MRKGLLDTAWSWGFSVGIHSVLLLGGTLAALEFRVGVDPGGTGFDCAMRDGTPSIDRIERIPDQFGAFAPDPDTGEDLRAPSTFHRGSPDCLREYPTVYLKGGPGMCGNVIPGIYEEYGGRVNIVVLPPAVHAKEIDARGNRVRPTARKFLETRHALHRLGIEIDPACIDCIESDQRIHK